MHSGPYLQAYLTNPRHQRSTSRLFFVHNVSLTIRENPRFGRIRQFGNMRRSCKDVALTDTDGRRGIFGASVIAPIPDEETFRIHVASASHR